MFQADKCAGISRCRDINQMFGFLKKEKGENKSFSGTPEQTLMSEYKNESGAKNEQKP